MMEDNLSRSQDGTSTDGEVPRRDTLAATCPPSRASVQADSDRFVPQGVRTPSDKVPCEKAGNSSPLICRPLAHVLGIHSKNRKPQQGEGGVVMVAGASGVEISSSLLLSTR
ncbi:hypothetical protein EYF80_040755 [Liparis tanakae]|uniref:Uncharacterized protein n=1 Tax=Liparis tanakae TaxID=230148 RepID=A0A4Z2G652_9TELE|nr:hypothetical protein EYF80_040755 [Liparis tanakae]